MLSFLPKYVVKSESFSIAVGVLSMWLLGTQRESICLISVDSVEAEIYVGFDTFIRPLVMLNSNRKMLPTSPSYGLTSSVLLG